MSETAFLLALELVRAVRDGVSISRELGISYSEVVKRAAEIEATGREFTVADARVFLEEARVQLDINAEHIRAAKEAAGQ